MRKYLLIPAIVAVMALFTFVPETYAQNNKPAGKQIVERNRDGKRIMKPKARKHARHHKIKGKKAHRHYAKKHHKLRHKRHHRHDIRKHRPARVDYRRR